MNGWTLCLDAANCVSFVAFVVTLARAGINRVNVYYPLVTTQYSVFIDFSLGGQVSRSVCVTQVWAKYRRWILPKGSRAATVIEFSGNGIVKDPAGSFGIVGYRIQDPPKKYSIHWDNLIFEIRAKSFNDFPGILDLLFMFQKKTYRFAFLYIFCFINY